MIRATRHDGSVSVIWRLERTAHHYLMEWEYAFPPEHGAPTDPPIFRIREIDGQMVYFHGCMGVWENRWTHDAAGRLVRFRSCPVWEDDDGRERFGDWTEWTDWI